MLFKYAKYAAELPKKERRLYRILSLISNAVWLPSIYLAIKADYQGLFICTAIFGGLFSAIFAGAYRNSVHVWPFYLFFKTTDSAK